MLFCCFVVAIEKIPCPTIVASSSQPWASVPSCCYLMHALSHPLTCDRRFLFPALAKYSCCCSANHIVEGIDSKLCCFCYFLHALTSLTSRSSLPLLSLGPAPWASTVLPLIRKLTQGGYGSVHLDDDHTLGPQNQILCFVMDLYTTAIKLATLRSAARKAYFGGPTPTLLCAISFPDSSACV